MRFTLLALSSLWSSGPWLYSVSGRPAGRVEQSHGDISSDGRSCGARTMLPKPSGRFQLDEEGKESQTNRARHNLPGSADEHRETPPGIAGGRDETESEF